MKTKVLLHGGFAGHINTQNDVFFKEILKDVSNTTKVLLVLFAKSADKVSVNRDEDIAQFERNKGDKTISYQLADEESFVEQVKTSDAIYFHGGDTLKLLDTLKKFGDLKELFRGKIIAGESAGAYVLSKYFHSERAGGVFEGLGIVPVKTICHYTEKSKDREDLLKECSPELETLLLPDYSYRVFSY